MMKQTDNLFVTNKFRLYLKETDANEDCNTKGIACNIFLWPFSRYLIPAYIKIIYGRGGIHKQYNYFSAVFLLCKLSAKNKLLHESSNLLAILQ